jgi:Skp family chaperone for outer membrane proteins
VKISVCRILVAGLLSLGLSLSASAQQAARPNSPPPASGTSVAVLDINEVFEKNIRFKAAMDEIRDDIKAYETSVVEKRKQATAMNEKLAEYQPGSQEYKALETQLAQMAADMQVDMAMKKREFMEREAKLYYSAYMDTLQQVGDFASRYNISLVLRFNGEEIDPKERSSVLQGVNRAVVYQRNLNITDQIVQELNRGSAPRNANARPAAPAPQQRR